MTLDELASIPELGTRSELVASWINGERCVTATPAQWHRLVYEGEFTDEKGRTWVVGHNKDGKQFKLRNDP